MRKLLIILILLPFLATSQGLRPTVDAGTISGLTVDSLVQTSAITQTILGTKSFTGNLNANTLQKANSNYLNLSGSIYKTGGSGDVNNSGGISGTDALYEAYMVESNDDVAATTGIDDYQTMWARGDIDGDGTVSMLESYIIQMMVANHFTDDSLRLMSRKLNSRAFQLKPTSLLGLTSWNEFFTPWITSIGTGTTDNTTLSIDNDGNTAIKTTIDTNYSLLVDGDVKFNDSLTSGTITTIGNLSANNLTAKGGILYCGETLTTTGGIVLYQAINPMGTGYVLHPPLTTTVTSALNHFYFPDTRVSGGQTLATEEWSESTNVPYTGATTNVDLGNYTLNTKRLLQSNNGKSIFIGESAGLNDDLTDNYNTFIGYETGKANVSGIGNVFLGAGTGTVSLNSDNVGIGRAVLSSFTTGSNNMSIGFQSFGNLITGSDNIAIGIYAGCYTSATTNVTLSENSIYLGDAARASVNNTTNEIVVGHNAIGKGSNSIVLGDDNITDVWMGEVGGADIHATDGTFSGNVEITGNIQAKTQINTQLNGSKTATFTHDAASGDIGCYVLSTSGAVTVNIHNVTSGVQGTIFLNIATVPSSLTINGWTGAGTGALNERRIGVQAEIATNKTTSITYTYGYDGTASYCYLMEGQQE